MTPSYWVLGKRGELLGYGKLEDEISVVKHCILWLFKNKLTLYDKRYKNCDLCISNKYRG